MLIISKVYDLYVNQACNYPYLRRLKRGHGRKKDENMKNRNDEALLTKMDFDTGDETICLWCNWYAVHFAWKPCFLLFFSLIPTPKEAPRSAAEDLSCLQETVFLMVLMSRQYNFEMCQNF